MQERSYDRRLVLAVLSASMLIYAMQFTTIAVALGDLIDDLDAPIRWSGWVLTVFMLGQVVSQPVAGRLAERLGGRPVFLFGLAGFVVASLACTIAPNILVLIIARAAQGIAGGAFAPAAMGIVADAWGEERARPIGLVTAFTPIGTVIGPALGGGIVELIGWRGIFAVNVPLGVVGLVAALIVLPRAEVRHPARGRFDWSGLLLLTAATSALIFALNELSRSEGTSALLVVAGFATAVGTGALLLVRESRVPEPVVALDLIRRAPFAAANGVAFCYGAALFSIASFIPLYAREAYGMSDGVAGLLVTPRAVLVVTISAVASMLLPRTGYRVLLFGGLAGFSATLFLLSLGLHRPGLGGIEISDFVWLSAISAAAGLFIGALNPAMNNLAIHLEPTRIPTIVGLRSMFQTIGGMCGIALTVLVAARADTTGAGLEIAFAGFGVLVLATLLLVFPIPELPRRGYVVVGSSTPVGGAGGPSRVVARPSPPPHD